MDFRLVDAGAAFLEGREKRDERIKQNRLAQLASQAYGAAPGQQDGIVQQAIALDPQAGYSIGSQSQQATRGREQRVGQLAVLLSKAPEQMRGQLYRQMLPELQRIGLQAPPDYTPEVDQMVGQLASVYGGGGQASAPSVRSSFVGEDGQMYSIMSDGSVKAQGVGADRKLQAFDVPGVGPQVVDLRNATARTVTAGGAPQPQGSTFAFTPAAGAEGDPDAQAFQNLSPDQQAVAAQMLQQGQDFTIQQGRVVPSGMRGGQPMPAASQPPRGLPSIMAIGGGEPGFAPPGSPAWVRPASGGRGDAGAVSQLSAEEVQALGLPEGTVAQRGPDGKVTTIFTPDAGARKAARDAQMKMPRVAAATRRLDRLDAALGVIARGTFDGGPVDQYVLSRTPEGQEVVQASASLLPELTALTRVPGIGSQSDLETRLANLQLPSLEFPPQVNQRAIAELRLFMSDLNDAYSSLAGGPGQQESQAPQGAAAGNAQPAQGQYQPGQIIEANGKRYRVVGGDPNDPDVEEVI